MTYETIKMEEVVSLRREVARLKSELAASQKTILELMNAQVANKAPAPHPDQMSLFGEDGGAQ